MGNSWRRAIFAGALCLIGATVWASPACSNRVPSKAWRKAVSRLTWEYRSRLRRR